MLKLKFPNTGFVLWSCDDYFLDCGELCPFDFVSVVYVPLTLHVAIEEVKKEVREETIQRH